MIPQERGLEGINVYPYVDYLFFLKGGDRLRELLGEARRFLISPQTYLNLPVVRLRGWSLACPLHHLCVTSFLPSRTPMHLPKSSIHPHLRIGLGKGDQTTKELVMG
jgi:hypothetical protein